MNATIKLPLTLSFFLTRDDIAAFERLPREFSRSGTFAFFALFFLCGMALAIAEDEAGGFTPAFLAEYAPIVSSIVAAAIAYAIVSLALTLRIHWRIAKAEIPHAETQIEASELELKVTDGRPPRSLVWGQIARVIDAPAHVFLCLTPRNAVIVPLRAFQSIDEMRAFADLSETLSRRADGDA